MKMAFGEFMKKISGKTPSTPYTPKPVVFTTPSPQTMEEISSGKPKWAVHPTIHAVRERLERLSNS